MEILRIIAIVVIGIYAICFLPAVFFTREQEKTGMRIESAPNRLLGLIFHFLTVWVIMPGFIVHQIINIIKNK